MYILAFDFVSFGVKTAQFILSFSILVVLHELGHFIPARLFKTRVEKFYLFFNPGFSLWKKKIGETEYGIGWIPFGGYVKISGMIDESMDKDQMKKEPDLGVKIKAGVSKINRDVGRGYCKCDFSHCNFYRHCLVLG